jgi:transcriptional regulator with XRE-family HTH domain
VELPLHETLRRLRDHAAEQELAPQELADQTALPVGTVRALLRGEAPPPDTVDERVCSRIKVLADAHLARTRKRFADLVPEVAGKLSISDVWARKLLRGEKTPNVTLLHGLVEFFKVDGGEAFFTASPADALNRALLKILEKYEEPQQDPVDALMAKFGVKAMDLRHHGTMTKDQLEMLLEGVIKSVVPREGDPRR